MKNFFLIIVSIMLFQGTAYAMKQRFCNFFNRGGQGEYAQNEQFSWDEKPEILPNLYLSSLAQLLDKTPSEFLDIPMQNGTIRDYIAFQDFADSYFQVPHLTRNNSLNINILSALCQDDNTMSYIVGNLCQNNLKTKMFFATIQGNLQQIIEDKRAHERKHSVYVAKKILPLTILGFNVSVVAGIGSYLLAKKEQTALGYTALFLGLSGATVIVPKLYKKYSALQQSAKNIQLYTTNEFFLKNDSSNENTEIRCITN